MRNSWKIIDSKSDIKELEKMGMYTELVCAFELKENTPNQIINTLEYMTGQLDEIENIPSHELFKCERWRFMLQSDSYYFDGDTHSTIRKDLFGSWYVTIRCNLKNYDNEIEKFIDWIKPYSCSTGFIGYKRCEKAEEPDLIFI
jgi:hypothetical protein